MTKIAVDEDALKQLIGSIDGPDYLVRELKVIEPIDAKSPLPVLRKNLEDRELVDEDENKT